MGLVNDTLTAKLIKLAEEQNKLLREILAELKDAREARKWPSPPRPSL